MIPPVALTLGDPAGIGGEIALKAWAELDGTIPFFLIGDPDHMTDLARRLGLPITRISAAAEATAALGDGLPVLAHPLARLAPPGEPVPENAAAVVGIIARGVELARSGEALALCTNPINKKALKDGAGFAFPGHTEFLAHLSGAALPVMMLAAPALRVVPVTIHIPLAEVPAALTAGLLERTLRVTQAALRRDFGLDAPRIAVAGLNPHAGEGAMGREEIALIAPVLDRLRAGGMDVSGPRSADTLFHPAARRGYDVAVCMYHDQALIPLKTLDFDGGVNVTLGLDFVRTSPDHGTAYDIAGQNRASPSSLIAALRMAWEMGVTRRGRGVNGEETGDGLPPLRAVIAAHGLAARKSLGQNFLLDLNLTGKIARQSGDLAACDVLEIGPGPGGLTRALLMEGARHVVAIERDARCLPALAEIAAAYPGRLTVLEGDALALDPLPHLTPPIRIVANLPYNVGTELLVRWLTPKVWPPFWSSLTLMFQKEVAERIVARPGSKAYGRLAILAQWRATPRLVFELPPRAFTPPPKVTSAVVRIEALAEPRFPADPAVLSRVVALAFGQRRKMLRASLRPLGPEVEDMLRAAGIPPTERAEQVSLEAFCHLSRLVAGEA